MTRKQIEKASGLQLDFFLREREREDLAFFRIQNKLHFSSPIKKIKGMIKIKIKKKKKMRKAFLLKR